MGDPQPIYILLSIHVTSSIHRKPALEHVLEPLLTLLSSSKANDAISEELVETVGFDNIELSMELLEKRQEAVQQISAYLHGRMQSTQLPAQTIQANGRSKGKQREGNMERLA